METGSFKSNIRGGCRRWWAAMLVSAMAAAAASVESARTQEQAALGAEAQSQRLQCGGRLESLVKEPDGVPAGTPLPVDPLCEVSPELALLPARRSCQAVNQQSTCEACLEKFVQELDGILAENPRSVDPLDLLLDRTFPLKNCNVDEALKIVGKSKYFASVEGGRDEYVISFGNARGRPHTGYRIGFSLLKQSGNSNLPYALVNK